MSQSEFLPTGFFICDSCGNIVDAEYEHTVYDHNGTDHDTDAWHICHTCYTDQETDTTC